MDYLNGSRQAPGSGYAAATLRFEAPPTPGTDEFRLFLNNGYARAGTSAPVSVLTPPSITISDAVVVEGNSGTSTVTFTVTLAPVNPTQAVTVNYATANGSATAGSDYGAVSGTLTFAPSMTTQTFSVNVLGDTAIEPTETFLVNLSGVTNAAIGDGKASERSSMTMRRRRRASRRARPPSTPARLSPLRSRTAPATRPTGWPVRHQHCQQRQPSGWVFLNGLQSPPSAGITMATE